MKLTRLRIEQFKQFRQPLEIDALEPGLNLFIGANEAGKSTVVAAIRAAFFERHRSGSVDELRPWGDSSASPSVELEFDLGDRHCRLAKSFLHKKRCELQWGGERFDGADAEDKLADLLGFQHASKGVSKAEHWGIPGLLWIAQGTAHDIRAPVVHATDHLRRALNESLGEVASSGGDEVLAKVEAARNELLTASTGAPRAAYADAIKREAALAARLAETEAEIATYRRQVDSLAALRREQAADEADKPWLDFRAKEQDAAARLAAIQDVERELAAARQQAGQFDERLKLLRHQLDTYAGQARDAGQRRAALAAARERLAEATVRAEEWQRQHADAVAREAIWRRILPRAAPLSEDVDFAALARRTNALVRSSKQLSQVMTLWQGYHNLCRPHRSLKLHKTVQPDPKLRQRTPAMVANIVDCVWSFERLLRTPTFPALAETLKPSP